MVYECFFRPKLPLVFCQATCQLPRVLPGNCQKLPGNSDFAWQSWRFAWQNIDFARQTAKFARQNHKICQATWQLAWQKSILPGKFKICQAKWILPGIMAVCQAKMQYALQNQANMPANFGRLKCLPFFCHAKIAGKMPGKRCLATRQLHTAASADALYRAVQKVWGCSRKVPELLPKPMWSNEVLSASTGTS